MPGDLYITGDPEVDDLLNDDGTALLIGMLFDQQVTIAWAFRAPATLRSRLGHLDAAKIAEMDPEDLVATCCEKPAVHRYPAAMARRLHELCAVIETQYGGDGANVWDGVSTARQLHTRLSDLPGFGDEKAKIMIAMLAKRFGVKPRGWKQTAAPFGDDHPRTVADMGSAEQVSAVKAWKKAAKVAGKSKQD